MKTNKGKMFLTAMAILFSIFINEGVNAQNGSIETVGSQKILNLWGTNYEMGYAHGYLMASEIRDLVDNVMIGYFSDGYVSDYNQLLADDVSMVTWRPEYLEEINGMAAGMAASGKNIYVSKLGRNVDARDIRAFNLVAEYIACSSLGVWGNGTANGETLLGRNMDFYVDPKGNLVNYQMLITFEPAVGNKVVAFSLPGWIGVHSGMTGEGISLMINMGYAGTDNRSGLSPSMEVMRRILDNVTPQNFLTTPLSIVSSVFEYSTFAIQMGSPYLGGSDPVYYVEDGVGSSNVNRFAADTNPGYQYIIATNHFLKLPGDRDSGSTQRYDRLKNGLLNLYSTGDFKVDSTEVRSLLNSVADYDWSTHLQVIIRPNRMEFDLAFAKKVSGVFTGVRSVPVQTYKLTDLFPNHDPNNPNPPPPPPPPPTGNPDLTVSSISAPASGIRRCQVITVSDTTRNSGAFPSEASITKFYLSKNSSLDTSDTYLGLRSVSALGKGALSSGSTQITIPCGIPTGYYYIIGMADADKVITETNEGNNTRSRMLSIR